jgi:chromosome segregation ATPase
MKVESSKIEDEYKELKTKYSKKLKENKMLKSQLDNMIESIQGFQTNYNSIVQLYSSLTESIKSIPQVIKEDTSTFSTQATSEVKTLQKIGLINNTSFELNPSVLKKLKEMETNYFEMSNNFNQLVLKYKLLKDEKDELETANSNLKEEMDVLSNSNEELEVKSKYKNNFIERFKELNRCLIDAGINSAYLNTYEHKRESNASQQNKSSTPYIVCEPLPSFLKFINKFTNIC